MAWQTIPGIIGKVYLPEPQEGGKKHPCPGCFSCQKCSLERCHVCRSAKRPPGEERSSTLPREASS